MRLSRQGNYRFKVCPIEMAKKQLLIKYLKARLPFADCGIQFVVKSRPIWEGNSQTEIPLLKKSMAQEIEERISIELSEKDQHSLALFLMAVSKINRVVCIGWINLDLSYNCYEKQGSLMGIDGQDGYIVYSVIDPSTPHPPNRQNFSDQSLVNVDINYQTIHSRVNQQSQPSSPKISKQQAFLQFYSGDDQDLLFPSDQKNIPLNSSKQVKPLFAEEIQSNHNKSLNIHRSSFAMEDEVVVPAPEIAVVTKQQKKKQQRQGQHYTNKTAEDHQLTIEILKHRLKNAQYYKIIMKNEIFQLSNQDRIAKLTGKAVQKQMHR